jgi:hypothetical protein
VTNQTLLMIALSIDHLSATRDGRLRWGTWRNIGASRVCH